MGRKLCETGIDLPDVKQMLKCPIDGTNALNMSQMANGTSADAAVRCPCTRKVRQRRVDQTKQNFVKKTATEKESLTRSRRTNDKEHRCVMEDSISQAENSVNDVTSLLEEKGNVSGKRIQMDNRTTVSSKESNGDRLVLLAIEKQRNWNRMNSKTKEASLDYYKEKNWANIHNMLKQETTAAQ